MPSSSLTQWRGLALHFFVDVILVALCFHAATVHRFGDWTPAAAALYLPSVVTGALVFASSGYIFGLYTPLQPVGRPQVPWGGRLAAALVLCIVGMMVVGAVNFSARIGRGVLYRGVALTVVGAVAHHAFIRRRWKRRTHQVVGCLVTNEDDLAGAEIFRRLDHTADHAVGLVVDGDWVVRSDMPVIGAFKEMEQAVERGEVQTILCTDAHLTNPRLSPSLRRLRYGGVEILSLTTACETVHGAVPLSLLTDMWLVNATSQPGLFYIKKLKRAFDIALALVGIALSWPLFLAGFLAVKLASPGPAIFSQVRSGRFGRPFRIFKLRTMHVEREGAPAQWAQKDDPRLFAVGKWLRQFRIDEIPQLWNILRGDMSFVGPRPEQPALVARLRAEIPYFGERLLAQPGLTGWAQVRYPYGASVEDSRRKLEYDLYYMKHVGLLLDLFILMDTVRIVLTGGVRRHSWKGMEDFNNHVDEVLRNGTAALPATEASAG